MTTGTSIHAVVLAEIRRYARRAKVLRQIHSNKGSRAQRSNRAYLVATVVVASTVSIIGFMGTQKLTTTLQNYIEVQQSAVEGVYSLSVLAILIITILGLIYRFEERGNRHYRSIERLTDFIRDIEDAAAIAEAGGSTLGSTDLDAVRVRYEGILAVLPPSTDREYVRAKEAAAEKRRKVLLAERPTNPVAAHWDDATSKRGIEPALGNALAELMNDPTRRTLLVAVRDALGEQAWVTGGFVREAVWDKLHGYEIPTPWDDIDVIYYDATQIDEASEVAMDERLRKKNGNIRWSTKNEARMHVVSGDGEYESLEDAVSKFPEIATAVACRVGRDDRLKLIAPYGLSDLFNLIVRPSRQAASARFNERLEKKQWRSRWPNLDVRAMASSGEDA